jgi:hypothetical protein
MGWWKRLKVWQKGGVVLGGVHIIAYFLGVFIFSPLSGYFVLYFEYPWAYLLHLLQFPGDLLFFPFDLLVGTAFYAIIGALFLQIIYLVIRRNK